MKENNKSICTIFPNYRDFHFYKDPGQIPYRFSLKGYEASVVCYGNYGDYPETERHLKVVTVPDRYLTRKFNAGIVLYLVRHARRIDVLNVFHYSWSSLLFSFVFKTFNRKGFAYLKLDDCVYARRDITPLKELRPGRLRLAGTGVKGRVRRGLARGLFESSIDLWSIEDDYSREIVEAENPSLKGKLITVFNGHTADLQGSTVFSGLLKKEDIILTAGRLGSFQKATEILLEAFRIIAGESVFSLHLAGQVDPGFKPRIESFFQENPLLRERVFFHGPLQRRELYELYNRSRIFCLPSRFEGMAIVFPEAMHYGNAIVTTGDVSLKPLIDIHRFGITVERDDPRSLADALLILVRNREMTDRMAETAREISSSLLSWDRITNVLIEAIETGKKQENQ